MKTLAAKARRMRRAGQASRQEAQRGLTLFEIILVIALIGTLMTMLITNLTSVSDNARVDQARIGMQGVAQALQLYRVHNNQYPSAAQGLDALIRDPGDSKRWRGPYIEEEKLRDPWGNPYEYTFDGRKYELQSAGQDGKLGTEDDIFYPERAAAQPAGG